MQAVGIITEYNPFHNGHIYHIQQAKKLTGADVVVAVMSGNFVQRGEPALFDKWQRTQMALENGVDLVIELPTFFAVQSSHIFADGAIQLLSALGVDNIVFGSEHPEVDFLSIAKQAPTIAEGQEFKNHTQTFASAYAKQLEAETSFKLEEPNDILALGYASAILNQQANIGIIPIHRAEANYHDANFTDEQSIASASSIRLALHKGKTEKIKNVVPEATKVALATAANTIDFESNFWSMLKYRLTTDTVGQLGQIYQMAEGLEHRFAKTALNDSGPQSYQSFIKSTKSKRYTFTRIQRTLLYTLLNIKVDQMQAAMQDPYLRILGFTSTGQQYLNEIKKQVTLPLISKVDSSLAKSNLRLDYKAGKVWQLLANEGAPTQDVTRMPLYWEK
ncbi:nucleotidyltransferase [Leuconostoc mesenteroides subsp. mesenteroides]|uniref:nucleotidyltransferase n=1 Tax=Leuconostoc mesenteroides TaxID=1245 RepID=UPI000E08FF48|nr:nucleotidyltransferase [Leuconostoc mesenteroides]RDF88589.1 nucleotidyltransferase [Leuconostoc mesenteroides subsp. mesenteroides]